MEEIKIVFTPNELKEKREHFNKLIEILIDLDFQLKISSDGYCTIINGTADHKFDGSSYELISESEKFQIEKWREIENEKD